MPYPLRTHRLLIDPLTEPDLLDFVLYRQDPDVARWQSWEPTYSDADALRLIGMQPETELPAPGRWIQLAIRNAAASVLYGDLALHRLDEQPDTFEVGVTFAPTAQGHGIGTEAVRRLVEYVFDEAAAHRVVASCDTRNGPVTRLLRRIGMRQESSQVGADFCKGEWITLDGYALLAGERTPRVSPPGK